MSAATDRPAIRLWLPEPDSAKWMGGLPEGFDPDIWGGGESVPASAGEVEVVVTPYFSWRPQLSVLRDLPKLRFVQTIAAGVDSVVQHIPPGVTLCNGKGANDASTAEFTVGIMLAHVRELPAMFDAQARREWKQPVTGTLAGRTVMILGYGSIGAALERRLDGFEVEIIRVASKARPGVHAAEELPALLPRADIVVILLPITEATRGMIDARFLSFMKDGALLMNASRGVVVDHDALLAELRSGRLRAALDVTEPEPLPSDHPLWTAPGALITPHAGGSTTLVRPRVYALIRRQLERYRDGEPLENVIDLGKGY